MLRAFCVYDISFCNPCSFFHSSPASVWITIFILFFFILPLWKVCYYSACGNVHVNLFFLYPSSLHSVDYQHSPIEMIHSFTCWFFFATGILIILFYLSFFLSNHVFFSIFFSTVFYVRCTIFTIDFNMDSLFR